MILITGSEGFIGRHLVRTMPTEAVGVDLRAQDAVDIRSQADMVCLKNRLSRERITACVHLAAIASPPIAQRDPINAWDTNVRGTHNVLELLRQLGVPRVIFLSSAHVYGISPRYLPTDERHPLALHDTYTTTKIAGEQLCQLYYENHGLSYCTLRLWNAYGPGQAADYFIGAKLQQARAGKLTIRNAGVTKDWVHVSDVVRAIQMALVSDYVGPLNVGTGIETSLGAIVSIIGEVFDLCAQVEDAPPEGPTRMCCDYRRIERTLGWRPLVPFEEGLALLINTREAA